MAGGVRLLSYERFRKEFIADSIEVETPESGDRFALNFPPREVVRGSLVLRCTVPRAGSGIFRMVFKKQPRRLLKGALAFIIRRYGISECRLFRRSARHVIDPRVARALVVQDITLIEEQRKLADGSFRAIGAMDQVETIGNAKVAPDGAAGGL